MARLDRLIRNLHQQGEDMCFVYFDGLNEAVLALASFEAPCIKVEQELATKLRMEPQTLYCYYKRGVNNARPPFPTVT